MYFAYYNSPVGKILLTGEKALKSLHFPIGTTRVEPKKEWKYNEVKFSDAISQLEAYFKGDLQRFDLNLNPMGTPFQKKVWQELVKIPYGETISYGELANRIGNPNASRAVGMANGKNPISIIIPCHRVIGKDGSMTGFGGGITVKKKLLDLEAKVIR